MDACKQDCFFDGNSGAGDDGCNWQLKCDPQSVEPKCPYESSTPTQHANECSVSASQSQTCVDKCRKLVPNGCDCFGCCLIPGAPTPIRLAATCTAADFGNPAKCPTCTQVTQCSNPCDHCEICIGKPTLPAECTRHAGRRDRRPPPPPNDCGSDFVPCGPGTPTPVGRLRGRTTVASPAAVSRPASVRLTSRPIQRLRPARIPRPQPLVRPGNPRTRLHGREIAAERTGR